MIDFPVSIDIETRPITKMVKYLPEPDVKYGNTKDEEKRKVMRDDAVMRQLQGMALSPLYGEVIAAVIVHKGKVIRSLLIDGKKVNEFYIIDQVFSFMRLLSDANPVIITWNGTSFDVPFLYKRAIILDSKKSKNPQLDAKCLLYGMPPISYYTKRYDTSHHIDLPLVWGAWDSQAKYIGLNSVVLPLLHKEKVEIDYDMEAYHALLKTQEGRETVLARCEQDTLLADQVYWLIKGILI